MSQKETFSDATVELARNYEISDLIFRFNCANYFYAGKSDYDTKTFGSLKSPTGDSRSSGGSPSLEAVIGTIKTNKGRGRSDARERKLYPSTSSAAKRLKLKPEVDKTNFSSESLSTPLTCSEPVHTSVITLAVDATPTRVGGLLRLPGNERTIFYYSVNWSDRFVIDDPTMFEMINTALALQLFEPYLKAYRDRYDDFVVKTDNHFFESMKSLKNPYDFEFLMNVQKKVKSYQGEFQHAVISMKDPDIQNADYLSRTDLPRMGLKFGYRSDQENTDHGSTDYALVDLSSVASGYTLNVISEDVPVKYLKAYSYDEL